MVGDGSQYWMKLEQRMTNTDHGQAALEAALALLLVLVAVLLMRSALVRLFVLEDSLRRWVLRLPL